MSFSTTTIRVFPNPEEDDPEIKPLIFPWTNLDKEFIAAINVKNLVTRRNAHCAMLDTGVFRSRKPNGDLQHEYNICRYCTAPVLPYKMATHEENCRSTFKENTRSIRVRYYKELAPGKRLKTSPPTTLSTRCPFASTTSRRVDAEGRHQPFSYAILYVNIFDLSKSIQRMASSLDPKELLEWFLDDVIEMGEHHHALQCVDFRRPQGTSQGKNP
jgi:hypothetical protein